MAIKNLVIVESPAKAKTIAKYLNNNRELRHLGKFSVMASMGHVRDLRKKQLSVDVENDFETDYEILKDKIKLVDELKKKVLEVDNVYLAADFDREGEAICEHLKNVLKLRKYHRITFTEITPSALQKSILSPREIDYKLVDAQETRRILDRLVGFKISPLLWKRYNAANVHLSAGRVQSAALHLIKEKEDEIINFNSTKYWYLFGNFKLDIGKENHELNEVKLYQGERVYKIDEDINDVKKLMSKWSSAFHVADLKSRQLRQNPDLPFITSSLQQEAYSKLGFPLKRTMHLAQQLYEKGYITYMRTDSYNISDEFKNTIAVYINSNFGENYYEPNNKKKKQVKNAQEAHEAIRPTNINTLNIIEQGFTQDHKKLYDLIWKRTIASFMKAAIYDELEFHIHCKDIPKDMYFQAAFRHLHFNGYLVVYGLKSEVYNFTKYIDAIKDKKYKLECKNIIAKNTWTHPPQRFSEASIIKTLENESIGRPSTFATILTKLFEKHYVEKSDVRGIDKDVTHLEYVHGSKGLKVHNEVITVGHERGKLVPSAVGIEIDKFMEKYFEYIIDKTFTATMEEDLDKIADGNTNKIHVLKSFWKNFGKDVQVLEEQKKTEKQKLQPEQKTITLNGNTYIIRIAKYGPVIQYQQGETTKYIDIKAYLRYVGKSYTDITEEDVSFLSNLPVKIATVDGHDLMLTSGPYGLYFKHNNENIKIPLKTIKKLINVANAKETISQDELKAIVDYKKNMKKVAKTNDNATTKALKSTKKVAMRKKIPRSKP
jgi:DNA topoisomerase-1